MRWLKKREFIIYSYLAIKYGGETVSTIDTIYEVKKTFRTTTRTAKNIIKRLVRAEYLIKIDNNNLKVRELNDTLTELICSYIHRRAIRTSTGGR